MPWTRRPAPALLLAVALLACRTLPDSAGPATVLTPPQPAEIVQLPNQPESLKFAVIGDFGTGRAPQYQMAEQMAVVHRRVPYSIVLTVGDNIYGSERPRDFERKFELPYKALLDAGVKFYASLGNHDSREQRFYELFNMDGQRYYSFSPARHSVRFLALETDYLDRAQLDWVERELKGAREDWKIAYFHHPLYSSGARHGSDLRIREALEPLFVKYNVSVVFAGHDHTYERIHPQEGIVHFVVGSTGQLRRGNLRRTTKTAAGFDRDQAFLAAEIAGDQLYFNAVSRTGQIVDSGVVVRRGAATTRLESPSSSPTERSAGASAR